MPRGWVGIASEDACFEFKALLQAEEVSPTRPTHLLSQQAVVEL